MLKHDGCRNDSQFSIQLTGPRRRNFLQNSQANDFWTLVPGRFALQLERALMCDKEAPAERRLRLAVEIVGHDEKEKIGATVA